MPLLTLTVAAFLPQVHRVPHVAVLSTGDEITEPGALQLRPGAIRDANRPMLLAAAAEVCSWPLSLFVFCAMHIKKSYKLMRTVKVHSFKRLPQLFSVIWAVVKHSQYPAECFSLTPDQRSMSSLSSLVDLMCRRAPRLWTWASFRTPPALLDWRPLCPLPSMPARMCSSPRVRQPLLPTSAGSI